MKKSYLILESGEIFEGEAPDWQEGVFPGEVVFTTGMCGYNESLTDPSFADQILVFTYPLIGNYGVADPSTWESKKIHAAGVVVNESCENWSHHAGLQSLQEWLKKEGVPLLTGVDTRALTKTLRSKGALLGAISDKNAAPTFVNPNLEHLVAKVSISEKKTFGEGKKRVIAVDCGMKESMFRQLEKFPIEIVRVPYNYDYSEEPFDGVFLSNGPGDPIQCAETVAILKKAMKKNKPIFGVCLGSQLLAHAAGAKTYKLPFGHRGQNQPCMDLDTGKCYITSQNHGFAVDEKSLPEDWEVVFRNLNDASVEGIAHATLPFYAVQFHPEASPGPTDTRWFFERFYACLDGAPAREKTVIPQKDRISSKRKILILGSGGLRIGQAGEFDYSGSQAIKALKEEGHETILVNPNIATVQTDKGMADKVFLLPLNEKTVTEIIDNERPDAILLSFGGQTALNLGLQLEASGVLAQYGVEVLGTPVDTIRITEDRKLFKEALDEIDVKTAISYTAHTVAEAKEAANKIGYPVMLRSGFSLGGLGSGRVANEEELITRASEALSKAPQILIEEYLAGWKEIEYEVVRDSDDNTITVCNMENFDPMGIHTGESIVVAPSQTLNNEEYHYLREVAIKTVRHLGVVGECNIQYAVHPNKVDYRVIEVNARLSRSSALASKATGYPLAFVAAKLALGYKLHEIKNSVTKETSALFEPALDYIVVKMPRWDIAKLRAAERTIGSEMKSVGEVMAIGRSFPEALQKAVRMLNIGCCSLFDYPYTIPNPKQEIACATDRRLYAIAQELREGMDVEEIHALSKIDRWFLHHLAHVVGMEKEIEEKPLEEILLQAKRLGFSDKAIALLRKETEGSIRTKRLAQGIKPVVKQIDTLAGEFEAETNYLYLTYHGTHNDLESSKVLPIMVMGSGPYAIGSSVEFDWCAVNTVRTLRRHGEQAIMINSNPETVSTDYDESDRLYFEELTLERVCDIADYESPKGIVISVGGQIANNLALPLYNAGYPIMGTPPSMIDMAENRQKFSSLLGELEIDQPAWVEVSSIEKARTFAKEVGYPILVRPSYVLSGAAMNVIHNAGELDHYLEEAAVVSREHPVVLSQFILNAKELEIDGVASDGKIVIEAISEHIENAGVHSGDATIVLPPQKLYLETIRRTKSITREIVKALNITGPFNIQFIAKDNAIKVIELNVRASRSFPFVSKVTGHNFIEIATEVLLGKNTPRHYNTLDLDYVGIKTPQFSYSRLKGANPVAHVEMASTGEVACLGGNFLEAFFRSWEATEQSVRGKKLLVSIGGNKKSKLLEELRILEARGWQIYTTPGTHDYLSKQGVATRCLYKASEGYRPNVVDAITEQNIDLIINIPSGVASSKAATDGFRIRRLAIDYHIPLITNLQIAQVFLHSLVDLDSSLPVKPWNQFIGVE